MAAVKFTSKDVRNEAPNISMKFHQPFITSKNDFFVSIKPLQKHMCLRDGPYVTSDGVKTFYCPLISDIQTSTCNSVASINSPAKKLSQTFSSTQESILKVPKSPENSCRNHQLTGSIFRYRIHQQQLPTRCLQKCNVTVLKSCHFRRVKRNGHNFSPRFINSASLVQNKYIVHHRRQPDSKVSKKYCFQKGEFKKFALIHNLSQSSFVFLHQFSSLKYDEYNFTTLKSSRFKNFRCKKWSVALSHRKPAISTTHKVKTESDKCDFTSIMKHSFVPKFSKSDLLVASEAPNVYQNTKFLCGIDEAETSEIHSNTVNSFKVRVDVQGGGVTYPRTCDKCHRTYSRKCTFYFHIKSNRCGKVALAEADPKKHKSNLLVCPHCSTAYSGKNSYRRHLKSNCPQTKVTYISCIDPSCSIKFRTQSAMMRHLVESHNIDLGVQKKTFTSMEEFEEWKRHEERQSFTMLTKRRGEYFLGGRKTHYYSCKFNVQERRSAVRTTNIKHHKGPVPNYNCPARIDLLEGVDEVQMTYYSYHNHELNHENLKFCRWDRETREYIDKMIENKVPIKKIQEELISNNFDSGDPVPLKEHFITVNQINRMKHRLTAKRKIHKKDAVCVQLLINVLYADKPDAILIYKPQGKPLEIGDDITQHLSENNLFVLGIQEERQRVELINSCRKILCIDTICFTKMYNFYLINFLVQDEFSGGYPVAHFITNRVDSNTLIALFTCLKSKCPYLEINAFMTSDNPVLYNAFSQVFENKPIHFLCKQQLKLSWLNQLNQKVENSEMVPEIYSCLDVILEESNYETFQEMLSNFLVKYQSICPSFCKHFSTHYAKKPESWAMCFRNLPYAAADSSAFCEIFHKKIKMAYLNKKVNRKVDDLINIILKVDKHFHLALSYKRFTEEVPTDEGNENSCRHWKGMCMLDESITEVAKSKFRVKPESGNDTCYIVKVISDKCTVPSVCYIQCHKPPCYPLCCHMYTCSCPDTNTLCIHIHKIHALSKSKNSSNSLNKSNESNDSDDDISFSDVLKKRVLPPEPSEDEKLVASSQKAVSQLQALLTNSKIQPLSQHVNETLKSLVSDCNGLISGKQPAKKSAGGPNSDHTYVSEPKKYIINYPPKKIEADRIFKPYPIKKTVKIPLRSIEEFHNFTHSLQSSDSLTKPLSKLGPYEIKLYHLKSLDPHISNKDVERIRSEVPDFTKGWLYDCIVYSYLTKIAESYDSVKVIDPCVSQVMSSSNRDVLVMIPICKYEKIFIPCNPSDSHWILLVVYPELKLVHFFDPQCGIVEEHYHQFIARWIKVLSQNSGIPACEWKIRSPRRVCQSDSVNCGVFISWYADQILKNQPTTVMFSIEMYRYQMYKTLKASLQNTTT